MITCPQSPLVGGIYDLYAFLYCEGQLPSRPSRVTATTVLRLSRQKEDAVRVQVLIESMPLWDAAVESASFDLPPQVVARIRDHAVFAATNGARVPRVEVRVTEQGILPVE
jgi:hypothetical protein